MEREGMAAKPQPNPPGKPPLAAPPLVSPPPANSIPAATAGSPFSPTPFSTTSTEQTVVSLYDWWLVRLEEKKIAVSGFTTRKQAARIFNSVAIVKRHDAFTLESADGIIILIQGMLNISRTYQNGFSHEVCDRFLIGFPFGWDNCTDLYVKQVITHDGSPAKSSASASSLKDSAQTYLEKFLLGNLINSLGPGLMGNFLKTAKVFSNDNTDTVPIQSQRCSNLSSGTPSVGSTCNTGDNDSSMRKRSASVVADMSEGCAAISEEVGNGRMNSGAGNISREAYHGEVFPASALLAPLEAHNSGPAEEEAQIRNEDIQADASEQEKVNVRICSVLNKDWSVDRISLDYDGDRSAKCVGSSMDMGSKDVLTKVATKDVNGSRFDLAEGSNDIAIRKLRNGKMLGLFRTPLYNSFDQDASKNVVASVLTLDSERTPEASVKKRGYRKRASREALNEKIEPNEEITTPSVLRSQERLRASNQGKRHGTRVEEYGSKVLQATSRSRMSRTGRSDVHQSPLTRNKAKQLSVSTPESLKLSRTRSGRVIVPRLDLGCQNILYDGDGSIAGIVGPVVSTEEPRSHHKASKSEPAKRLKRSH